MGLAPDWPICDLLAHRVRATPDAPAVVAAADGQTRTYAELDRHVAATADWVTDALDATTDGGEFDGQTRPRVVVTAQTDVRFLGYVFGAWRAGAQVVPVSADRPAADRDEHLDRLAPDLVIAAEPDARAWNDRRCPVRTLDDGPPADDSRHDSEPDRGADRHGPATDDSTEKRQWRPDETALVLFTSGTTGAPRGVRLTHGNLVASAVGSAFRLGLDPAERWLDCLPTNHMGGLAPIVRSALYGTTVVLQRAFDPARTAAALCEHDVTAVSLVPTQLHRLLEDGWKPPESLGVVLLGGAPASRDLIESCEEAGVPVCPTYGTTETASQIATVAPGEATAHPETVGSPLVVADVTILDPETAAPVAAGEVGELVVDGPVLTPGYLDDAATQAAVGERGLHTGDLASRDAAGRLTIHGRLDDAIQTGGETVHPWRVAAALDGDPAVAEAAVVGLPDSEWGERVAALVVPADDASVDGDALRERCRRELAPYEVPKTLRVVADLPRTASGTIDRDAVRRQLAE